MNEPKSLPVILHVTLGLDNAMIFCRIEHDGKSEFIAQQLWNQPVVYMINPMLIMERQGTFTLRPLNTLGNPVVAQLTRDVSRFHTPTPESIRFYDSQVKKFDMLTKDPSLLNVLNELSRKVKANEMTTEQARDIFTDLTDGTLDAKDVLDEACDMAESNAPDTPPKRTLH